MRKNVPSVRFKNFHDVWGGARLGDVAERVVKRNSNLESNLPLTISATQGIVSQSDYFNNRVASRDLSTYFLIERGDFAYNKTPSTHQVFGSLKRLERYDKGVVSPIYICFKPIGVDSQFLSGYYNSHHWHNEVRTRVAEGARQLLNIPTNDFFDMLLTLPSLKEQGLIGEFFTSLEKKIENSEQRYTKLKQLKVAYLDKLFPRAGEKEPQMRLKGFSGRWKEKRLGEIVDIIGGYAFASSRFNTGKTPIIRISNILENGVIGGEFIRYPNIESLTKFKTQPNDYLIAMSGATTGKVGKIKFSAYVNQRVGLFKQNENVNNDFIGTVVGSDIFLRYLEERWGGSAQPNISLKMLQDYELLIPSLEEQTAIGNFFKELDNLITLQKKKCEKLKQIKQFYLDKMFV